MCLKVQSGRLIRLVSCVELGKHEALAQRLNQASGSGGKAFKAALPVWKE